MLFYLVPLPAFSHRAVYFVEDAYQLSDNRTPSQMQEGRPVKAVKEAVNEVYP